MAKNKVKENSNGRTAPTILAISSITKSMAKEK
jgi:hypothetical protein